MSSYSYYLLLLPYCLSPLPLFLLPLAYCMSFYFYSYLLLPLIFFFASFVVSSTVFFILFIILLCCLFYILFMERSCLRAMSTILQPGDLFTTTEGRFSYIVLVVGVSKFSDDTHEYNVICLYNAISAYNSEPASSSVLGRLHATGNLKSLRLSGYKALIQEMVDSDSFDPLRRTGISTGPIHSNDSYTGAAFPLYLDDEFPEEMEPWLPYIKCLLKPSRPFSSYPSVFL